MLLRPPPPSTALVSLTQRLLRSADARAGEQLFGVVGSADRPRLQPAPQPAALELLVGFTAPRSWNGVAIVADGTARSLGLPDDVIADPQRIRVAFAVDRRGHHASSIADPGGRLRWSTAEHVEGFVADLCRRMLGLACPPENRTAVELVTSMWLEALLDLAADPRTAAEVGDWRSVALAHPATGPLDLDDDLEVVQVGPAALASRARQLAEPWDWERLRREAADGELVLSPVSPAAAEWMDAPFLARWLLGMHRPVGDLLDDLRLFLPTPRHQQVCDTVAASGVSW